jgi:hypothetical protein
MTQEHCCVRLLAPFNQNFCFVLFNHVKEIMTRCDVRLKLVDAPKMVGRALSSLQILYNLSNLRKASIAVDPYSAYNCLDRRSKCRFRLLACLAWVLFEPSCQVPPFSYLL